MFVDYQDDYLILRAKRVQPIVTMEELCSMTTTLDTSTFITKYHFELVRPWSVNVH